VSGLYRAASQLFATGALTWASAALEARLIGPAYTPDFVAHGTVADIPGSALLSSAVALSSPTVVNGVLKAANPTWPSLTVTDYVEAVLLSLVSGATDADHPLLALITGGINFGVSPSAEDVSVIWAVEGILAL
jgi:hypothetical protein